MGPLTTLGNNSKDSAYDRDVSETTVATSSTSYSGDQRTVSRRISDVPIAQVAVTTPNDDSDMGTESGTKGDMPDWKRKLVHSKAATVLRKPAPKRNLAPKRSATDGPRPPDHAPPESALSVSTTSKLGQWSAKR